MQNQPNTTDTDSSSTAIDIAPLALATRSFLAGVFITLAFLCAGVTGAALAGFFGRTTNLFIFLSVSLGLASFAAALFNGLGVIFQLVQHEKARRTEDVSEA